MTSLLQRARHLEYIATNLPSVSPLSKEWPKSPPYMKTQISGIKRIFHKWRVREKGTESTYSTRAISAT